MMFVQCVLGSAQVYADRDAANLPRLVVDTWSPVRVPETTEDRAEIKASDRPKHWIPYENARKYVETGGGAWQWVLPEGEAPPAPLLSGPLPPGFPHADGLRRAGIGALEGIPKEEGAIMKLPGLLLNDPETGKRPATSAKRKAANEILDAIDSIALNKKGG